MVIGGSIYKVVLFYWDALDETGQSGTAAGFGPPSLMVVTCFLAYGGKILYF